MNSNCWAVLGEFSRVGRELGHFIWPCISEFFARRMRVRRESTVLYLIFNNNLKIRMFESLILATDIDELIFVFNYFQNSIKVLQDFLV